MNMSEVRVNELRDFVEKEMKNRGMNATEFAKFVGVTHTTILRLIDQRNPTTPSPKLMVKLARKTGVNLSALIALVIPGVENAPVDPKSVIRAGRIGQLPPDKQDAIDEIILGMMLSEKK